jgi:hypothetical protein
MSRMIICTKGYGYDARFGDRSGGSSFKTVAVAFSNDTGLVAE